MDIIYQLAAIKKHIKYDRHDKLGYELGVTIPATLTALLLEWIMADEPFVHDLRRNEYYDVFAEVKLRLHAFWRQRIPQRLAALTAIPREGKWQLLFFNPLLIVFALIRRLVGLLDLLTRLLVGCCARSFSRCSDQQRDDEIPDEASCSVLATYEGQ